MKTALLLSGGMDSIAIAWWKKPELAITVDYGQRAAPAELHAAAAAAETMGIEHLIVKADLSALGSGDMAGTQPLALAPVSEWWPYRNQVLVTLAAMKGVTRGVQRLILGTLKSDGRHADGRPDFIITLDLLLRLQEGGLRLEAPAIGMTAAELIRTSNVPMEILAWAHSCHVGAHACGLCRGCQKHYETLVELGVDPY
jgi:7-cyano-7-deazaguanine synthase